MRKQKMILSADQYDQIKDLYHSGERQKDIAKIIGCAPSTVSDVLKNPERKRLPSSKPIQLKPFEEMELSCLPDNILFQHSKEYIL